jgi:AcrR family transcriptional regulator
MPKVTDEYLAEKRNFIMECASEVFKEKPLYQITMRDIIKKTEYSQGAIYRYYANVDEIFADLINTNSPQSTLERSINELLCSDKKEDIIISECIVAIGEYIKELLQSIGGKTCFELLATYAYDVKRIEALLPRLKFKQSMEYAQNKTIAYLFENVQKGIFNPVIPVEAIIKFVCITIDGISNDAALRANNSENSVPEVDFSEMFDVLAKAVVNFLGI